jgi:hypothetical protein
MCYHIIKIKELISQIYTNLVQGKIQNFYQKLITNYPNSTADREKVKQKIAHTNLNNFEIKNNIFQQVNQFVKELTKQF